MNGDSRNDILTPRGWLEAPADPRRRTGPSIRIGTSKTRSALCTFGIQTAMAGPDIVSSNAHGYGIFWLENTGDGKWVNHVIDDSW